MLIRIVVSWILQADAPAVVFSCFLFVLSYFYDFFFCTVFVSVFFYGGWSGLEILLSCCNPSLILFNNNKKNTYILLKKKKRFCSLAY